MNVMFHEEASWRWNDGEKDTIIQVPIDENFQQVHAPSREVSSLSSSHSSSLGNNNTIRPENSSSETPPRKVKSLREINDSCNFAMYISDAMCFENVTEDLERQIVMKKEIQAIKKTQLGSW